MIHTCTKKRPRGRQREKTIYESRRNGSQEINPTNRCFGLRLLASGIVRKFISGFWFLFLKLRILGHFVMAALGNYTSGFYHFSPLDPLALFLKTQALFHFYLIWLWIWCDSQNCWWGTRISFLHGNAVLAKFDAERPCKYLQVYPWMGTEKDAYYICS